MRVSLVPLLAAALAFSGCRDPKIASYRVPSEKPEPLPPVLTGGVPANAPSMPSNMANTAVPTATGSALTWTAPADWQPKPPSAMRKGSYTVRGDRGEADFSITAFPGDVGGELANVNRWRGQISLPPIGETDLAGVRTQLEQNGLTFTVVEFANTDPANPQRLIGALVPFEGATWFFKLTGPDPVVASAKPAFLELLRSVQAPAPATR